MSKRKSRDRAACFETGFLAQFRKHHLAIVSTSGIVFAREIFTRRMCVPRRCQKECGTIAIFTGVDLILRHRHTTGCTLGT